MESQDDRPDFSLTEENFRQWKRDNNTHYATEAFRCEHCLHCIAGIDEAFRRSQTVLDFIKLGQEAMAKHVLRCPAQRN